MQNPSDPRSSYGETKYNRRMSRIHYPMTYSNYPFNAIWAIVNSSKATSRTFPASLTQRHQLEESQLSKHFRNTSGKCSCLGAVISNLEWRIQSFQRKAVRARACVAAAGVRLLASEWALGGGAKLAARLTPSELTKITNCNCPLIKNSHFTIHCNTCRPDYDTDRAPRTD